MSVRYKDAPSAEHVVVYVRETRARVVRMWLRAIGLTGKVKSSEKHCIPL